MRPKDLEGFGPVGTNGPSRDRAEWDLRHECEMFVDRVLPFGAPQRDFAQAVNGVFNAVKFLLKETP